MLFRVVALIWAVHDYRASAYISVTPAFPRPVLQPPPQKQIKLARPSLLTMDGQTFTEIGVRSEVCDAMTAQGITMPNKMQCQVIPAIAGGTDCIIGAQTGAGKTLSYLIPILQSLKSSEELLGVQSKPKRPRAVVLVPTRELSEQVKDVAKSIAHFLKFRSACLVGGVPFSKQKKMLEGQMDLLVSTPGRLLEHMDRHNVFLTSVSHLVLDEVDTMFDAGFGKDLERIFSAVRMVPGHSVQCVAVGATHPPSAQAMYDQFFPGATRLMADVHRLPKGLKQDFITVSGPDAKTTHLVDLLRSTRGRSLVFCNTKNSSRFVDRFLTEAGFDVCNYHGGIPAEEREVQFDTFKSAQKAVMVCTDLAARGLDELSIDHVIQFDFPKTAIDYLHRAGRTARAGRSGHVTNLVTKFDHKLARAIQQAHMNGADIVLETQKVGDKVQRLVRRPSEELPEEFEGASGKKKLRYQKKVKQFSGRGSAAAKSKNKWSKLNTRRTIAKK